ncbi:hypothetical protein GAYE_SCF18G3910 [Galdieria yellowstonensis]|uniref:Translin n=1 Tax=Galdieria yellowstonensis TaxID=3028027 RepID=A0AAV9IFK3_9RHOD|nr:hypothetical protein GAYE_SCF18G3910 [Galdieria yellowstonensis]
MLKQSSASYLFQKLSEDLSFLIEKRERLVKASRDVTYQSKKVIYLLHRAVDEEPLSVFSKAEEQLHTIRKLICDLILSELSLENYYRFHEVFTTALQEYTEARLFCAYLKENRIMTLDELNAEIAHQSEQPTEGLREETTQQFITSISPKDYILGLVDSSGELMRHCINCASRNETDKAFQVECVLRQLSTEIKFVGVYLSRWNDNLDNKLEAIRANLGKVENACYQLYIRGMEFRQH